MRNISQELEKKVRNPRVQSQLKEMKKEILSDSDVQAFLKSHQDQVDEAMIQRSLSKLYEFVQQKEALAKGENTKFLYFYPKLMMNVNYIDLQYVANDEFLAQEKERHRRKRVLLRDLPQDLREASLPKFDVSELQRQEALTLALEFIEGVHPNSSLKGKGLYLYGPFGVGKSYLSAALANQLAELGHTTMILHYPSFITQMKQAIKTNKVQERLTELKEAEVLVLDDIGAENNSSWARDEILGVLLQGRLSSGRPTFFTSNFSMEELGKHLAHNNQGDEEVVKAERIMERIHALSREVAMGGRNRRYGA